MKRMLLFAIILLLLLLPAAGFACSGDSDCTWCTGNCIEKSKNPMLICGSVMPPVNMDCKCVNSICGQQPKINPIIDPVVICGDSRCDPFERHGVGGECVSDCGIDCNNDGAKDSWVCAAPPEIKYLCGDGICSGPETQSTCRDDCGSHSCSEINIQEEEQRCRGRGGIPERITVSDGCQLVSCKFQRIMSVCGDGICNESENKATCPADCGNLASQIICSNNIPKDINTCKLREGEPQILTESNGCSFVQCNNPKKELDINKLTSECQLLRRCTDNSLRACRWVDGLCQCDECPKNTCGNGICEPKEACMLDCYMNIKVLSADENGIVFDFYYAGDECRVYVRSPSGKVHIPAYQNIDSDKTKTGKGGNYRVKTSMIKDIFVFPETGNYEFGVSCTGNGISASNGDDAFINMDKYIQKPKETNQINIMPPKLEPITISVRGFVSPIVVNIGKSYGVEIKRENENLVLKAKDISVKTKETIEIKDSNLLIKGDIESFFVSLTPDELKEKIEGKVEDAELLIKNNRPIYSVKTRITGKFLGIFPYDMEVRKEMDTVTGNIEREERPWWSFLIVS